MLRNKLGTGVFMVAALAVCPAAKADLSDELEQLVGYTIADSRTIDGYRDENGDKSEDFEGCDFGRRIKFDDGKTLTCSSYSYAYAYRPTAIILLKTFEMGGKRFASVKMIVEDEVYDMQAIGLK